MAVRTAAICGQRGGSCLRAFKHGGGNTQLFVGYIGNTGDDAAMCAKSHWCRLLRRLPDVAVVAKSEVLVAGFLV